VDKSGQIHRSTDCLKNRHQSFFGHTNALPSQAKAFEMRSLKAQSALTMRDDAVQRLAGDLANAALAVVGAFGMHFIDLDQRLNKIAFVGIAGGIV